MRVPGLLVAVLVLGACKGREERPTASPAAPPPAEALVVANDPNLRFTYLAADGRFRLARRLDEVPQESRGAVAVVDLSRRGWEKHVRVLDARAEAPDGRYRAAVMDRAAFERLARAFRDRNRPPVTMYATAWCGVCARARTFLAQNGVRYVERDIEKDPAAARELREKAAKAGVDASGVPVFDVGGRIVAGFDESALRRLLRL